MPYLFALVLVFLFPLTAFAENNIIDKIQQLQQGIVTVETELVKIINVPNSHNKRTATYTRSGCGVIIDASGIIVTNTHTIINAPAIYVILPNGQKIPAEVVFASLSHDFSLLKIQTDQPLTAITLADSNTAKIGEPIIIVGNSDFNQSSLLSGNIQRILASRSSNIIEFIEVNVYLHKGDSGGPVFDRNGHLLGIVMAKHKSAQNIAVIIAANKIRDEYWHYK